MTRRSKSWLFMATLIFTLVFLIPAFLMPCTASAATPAVTALAASAVDEDSAVLNGRLTADGDYDVVEYGFYYDDSATVSSSDDKERSGTGDLKDEQTFQARIDDLDPDRTYYFKAYIIYADSRDNRRLVLSTNTRSFTTSDIGAEDRPQVITAVATRITVDSARLNAELDSEGDSLIREYGFYYGTTSATNTKKRVGTRIDEGDGFSLGLTDLKANTKYYFKAYARNEQGTAFGTVRSFTTKKVLLPEVATRTTTTGDGLAILNGVVTDKGGSSIESYGFYYGTSSNPTTKIKVGNGIAEDRDFSYRLTGLDPNRTYYVKAYATNQDGTGYGKVTSFKVNAARSPSVFIINSSWYNIQGSNQLGDAAPYINNNRTYLPIRPVGKAVGLNDADIIWNPTFQTVTLSGRGTIVHLTIGSRTMFVNGNPVVMDVAPEISSNRACLPIAHVVKAFGYTAIWDGSARSVTIR